MSLNTELANVRDNFYVNAPKSIADTIKESISSIKATYDPSSYHLPFVCIYIGEKV
jgi:hypothetical protein